jgi:RND family efflux transporter MFP subunit
MIAMRSIVISAACLAGVLAAAGCQDRSGNSPEGEEAAMTVRTAPPRHRVFTESLRVQGSIEAVHRAAVSARLPGVLDAIYVDESASVTNGQPLFQTDKVNLENAVSIERQNLRVAEASVAEAETGLRQAEAGYEKAALDLERFRRLYEQDRAVSKDAFEKIDLAHKQAATGLERAKAAVVLVSAREDQAATALRIAERRLSDSRVRAPFDGVVARRLREPGEFVGAGAPVLDLEDPRQMEALLTLGEEWFARIEPGRTRVRIAAAGLPPVEAVVSVRLPSVHAVARTATAKVLLPPGGGFAPGMICDAEVVFARHEGWGVPAEAVGLRDGVPVVFVVEGGTARLREVRPGLRDDGYLELLDGGTLADRPVVVEGQAFLNAGTPVRVVSAEPPGN